MKSVTVHIESDGTEDEFDHQLECMSVVNGRHYYNSLSQILHLLASYDRDKKLTPSAKKVLKDIKDASAPHLRGIFYENY